MHGIARVHVHGGAVPLRPSSTISPVDHRPTTPDSRSKSSDRPYLEPKHSSSTSAWNHVASATLPSEDLKLQPPPRQHLPYHLAKARDTRSPNDVVWNERTQRLKTRFRKRNRLPPPPQWTWAPPVIFPIIAIDPSTSTRRPELDRASNRLNLIETPFSINPKLLFPHSTKNYDICFKNPIFVYRFTL